MILKSMGYLPENTGMKVQAGRLDVFKFHDLDLLMALLEIAGRVTVYSVPECPNCLQAKTTLLALNLPVCDVDVSHNAALRTQLKELTGNQTVPQIFFNSVHVGGIESLQNIAPDTLESLVCMVRKEPVAPDALPLPTGNRPEYEERDKRAFLKLTHSASELSKALRNLILKLYSDHLSTDGKSVDYKGMSQNTLFEHYCELAVYLQHMELHSLSHKEKLAFFINVYNALVIHGNLQLGFPKNMWQRYRFFNFVSYLIGGEVFTLQDIENGVLRGNRKGAAQLLKPFSKNDPRLQVALPDAEPLIHFALNCGAKGCPPIRTYTPEDIDSQLRAAAEAFLEKDEGCIVDTVKGEVQLNQIFKWYKVDFGDTDEKLLNWVVDHMKKSHKKKSLKTLLSAGNIKISYMPYDWSTNSSN